MGHRGFSSGCGATFFVTAGAAGTAAVDTLQNVLLPALTLLTAFEARAR
ncbi:MAG: hypothetical protein AAF790_15050 [Planctomycetota bacterium]